jgi:uroporphyrinogen-III synthase
MNESANAGFGNLQVVAFENRKGREIAALISKQGGIPIIAPAMREIPLEENPLAFAFAEELLSSRLHAVLFTTGVGTRLLLEVLAIRFLHDNIQRALSKIVIVARGSKPAAVLREYKLPVHVSVPEPNTWHELVSKLDEQPSGFKLEGSRIAIQEYGAPNLALVEELTRRGAEVMRVPVYRWGLPKDTGPLVHALTAIISGQAPVVLFTNRLQVENVLRIAAANGLKEALVKALPCCVVCSIGPICSDGLREQRLPVDLEPAHPKMGPLVFEAARSAADILESKAARIAPACTRVITREFSLQKDS